MEQKMKKRILYLIGMVVLGLGLFYGGITVGAATSDAGSAGDPLITQSYLELRLNEITGGNATASFTKVTVSKGTTFVASEGTQIVLYSGSGTVAGTDGLVDLTGGALFKEGNTMVVITSYSIHYTKLYDL